MANKASILLLILVLFYTNANAQKKKQTLKKSSKSKTVSTVKMTGPLPGAYQLNEYLPLLQGKRVALFANNTSKIGNTHLVDTLRKSGVTIKKIFGPEHGFRGTAGAGDKVDNSVDAKTGIPIVSLYGKKRKPSADDLADVDVIVFDIQDVGVRFYTYISSLQDIMESAIEHKKHLIILDRPNPNGFYVDGPVLDTAYKSFIGMQPIPVVYGMTMGEYANFLLGEGLLHRDLMDLMMLRLVDNALDSTQSKNSKPNITVIKCRNYTHKSRYSLPEKPSPNLRDDKAIFRYPSTCFFEGTVLSEGRGTEQPFLIFGHPSLPKNLYSFTPVASQAAPDPKLKGQLCYGWNISDAELPYNGAGTTLQLKYLLDAYKIFPDKEKFFIVPKKDNYKPTEVFFNKLAGNAELMQQIKDGKSEAEIRASWQPKLKEFKEKRKKYLMYAE